MVTSSSKHMFKVENELDVMLVSLHTLVCFIHFSMRREHDELLCVVKDMQLL